MRACMGVRWRWRMDACRTPAPAARDVTRDVTSSAAAPTARRRPATGAPPGGAPTRHPPVPAAAVVRGASGRHRRGN